MHYETIETSAILVRRLWEHFIGVRLAEQTFIKKFINFFFLEVILNWKIFSEHKLRIPNSKLTSTCFNTYIIRKQHAAGGNALCVLMFFGKMCASSGEIHFYILHDAALRTEVETNYKNHNNFHPTLLFNEFFLLDVDLFHHHFLN